MRWKMSKSREVYHSNILNEDNQAVQPLLGDIRHNSKTVRTCEQAQCTEYHDWYGYDNLADLYVTHDN